MNQEEFQTFQTINVVVAGYQYGFEINEMTQVFKRDLIATRTKNLSEFQPIATCNTELVDQTLNHIDNHDNDNPAEVNMDVEEQISVKTPMEIILQSEDHTSNEVRVISDNQDQDILISDPIFKHIVRTKVNTYSRQISDGCRELSNVDRCNILRTIFTNWWRTTTRKRFKRCALNIPLKMQNKNPGLLSEAGQNLQL